MSVRRQVSVVVLAIGMFVIGVAVAPRISAATVQGASAPYVVGPGPNGLPIIVTSRGDVFTVVVSGANMTVKRVSGSVR